MTSSAHKSLYASSRYAKKMNEICVKYDEFDASEKNANFTYQDVLGIKKISKKILTVLKNRLNSLRLFSLIQNSANR